MLHNRHACCGFAAFYSLGFVLRSGRGAQNHLKHPVATIIAGMLFFSGRLHSHLGVVIRNEKHWQN
ncbi:MAG TPA: hypothetical protein VN843_00820, partial [Anaerolineales bacterium]|nr:hypothetical protein [Anaerolineales bacterium]